MTKNELNDTYFNWMCLMADIRRNYRIEDF